MPLADPPPTRRLHKAKLYDWKDSNLALFGSDTENNITTLFLNFCNN